MQFIDKEVQTVYHVVQELEKNAAKEKGVFSEGKQVAYATVLQTMLDHCTHKFSAKEIKKVFGGRNG